MELDNKEYSKERIKLTGKDTDLIILSKLDDKTLLSFCSVNKYANRLCYNEDFWRNRLKERFPDSISFKSRENTYRNFYLSLVKYLNLGDEHIQNEHIQNEHIQNYYNQNEHIQNDTSFWQGKLGNAAMDGNLDLTKYFLSKIKISSDELRGNANPLAYGLTMATFYNHLSIVKFLTESYKSELNKNSKRREDEDIHGIFIKTIGHDMDIAAQKGYVELTAYLLETLLKAKGSLEFKTVYLKIARDAAAEEDHIEISNIFDKIYRHYKK